MIRHLPVHQLMRVTGALALCAVAVHAQDTTSGPVAPGDRFVIRTLSPTGSGGDSAKVVAIDDRYVATLLPGGPVNVRGLTPHAAMDSVRARVSRYVHADAVSIGFERRIAILGEVRRPDLHYLDLTMHLRDAIAVAGGVPETGKSSEVFLVRDGVTERIRDWRNTGAGDRALQSGDQIIVPREVWYKRNVLPLLSATAVLASVLITLLR